MSVAAVLREHDAAELEELYEIYQTRPFGVYGSELRTAALLQSVELGAFGKAPALPEYLARLDLDPERRQKFAEQQAAAEAEKTRQAIKRRASERRPGKPPAKRRK